MKRTILTAVFLAAAVAVAPFAAAQAELYPVRPVRLIVAFQPGGSVDVVARLVAPRLSESLGQPVVVDNRSGASGNIGTEQAARARPDGYTLLIHTVPFVANVHLYRPLPYDPLADFAPVSMVSRFPFFLVVPASLPARSLAELVALVKAKPGQLSYASNGSGSIAHLGMEMLKLSTGMDLLHVPYKGFAPALPDLLSGRVTVMMADLAPIGAQLKAGSLRVLGATSRDRTGFMPEVPTIAELGLPGYEIDVWFALYAPAKTPADITARLNAEARGYLGSAEAKEAYGKVGHEPAPSTAEAVRARIIAEQKTFAKAVKDAKLNPE